MEMENQYKATGFPYKDQIPKIISKKIDLLYEQPHDQLINTCTMLTFNAILKLESPEPLGDVMFITDMCNEYVIPVCSWAFHKAIEVHTMV
jgi:hypothetical protein